MSTILPTSSTHSPPHASVERSHDESRRHATNDDLMAALLRIEAQILQPEERIAAAIEAAMHARASEEAKEMFRRSMSALIRSLREFAKEVRDEANKTPNGVRECERLLERIYESYCGGIQWIMTLVVTSEDTDPWDHVLADVAAELRTFQDFAKSKLRCSSVKDAAGRDAFLSLLDSARDPDETALAARIEASLSQVAESALLLVAVCERMLANAMALDF